MRSRKGVVTMCAATLTMALSIASCSRSQPTRLPLGHVDSIQPGATVTGVVPVQGWAVDEDGVLSVCLYVDRVRVACTADLGGVRPDVATAYPKIAGADKSGWTIRFDSSTVSPGNHQFVIQTKSKSGATKDLGDINVVVSR